jgi:hypothetical protein
MSLVFKTSKGQDTKPAINAAQAPLIDAFITELRFK